jgi:RNase P/RNase MRP subunit p30
MPSKAEKKFKKHYFEKQNVKIYLIIIIKIQKKKKTQRSKPTSKSLVHLVVD